MHVSTKSITTLCAALFAVAGTAAAESAHSFLRPDLKVGQQLTHVFSRADSIKGDGFAEYVARTSGTGVDTVTAVTPKAVVFAGRYRYDGHAVASAEEKRLADGVTDCWDGKCSPNRSSSGALFNRLLWGHPPRDLRVGTQWTATIDEPWELGPPGTETISVARLDPGQHEVTLLRDGHGKPAAGRESNPRKVRITASNGTPLEVTVVPGESHWYGHTIVREGIIVSDVIMVRRQVTLVAIDGRRYKGEERIYTLDTLLRDTSTPSSRRTRDTEPPTR